MRYVNQRFTYLLYLHLVLHLVLVLAVFPTDFQSTSEIPLFYSINSFGQ